MSKFYVVSSDILPEVLEKGVRSKNAFTIWKSKKNQ